MKGVKSDEIKPEYGLFPRSALNIFKTLSTKIQEKQCVLTFSLCQTEWFDLKDMLNKMRTIYFDPVTSEMMYIKERII